MYGPAASAIQVCFVMPMICTGRDDSPNSGLDGWCDTVLYGPPHSLLTLIICTVQDWVGCLVRDVEGTHMLDMRWHFAYSCSCIIQ